MSSSFQDMSFVENGPIDPVLLNALYRDIGWDRLEERTVVDTSAMLASNRYHIAALTPRGALVGFARVAGDPYVAQVLDVITHPSFRRLGIAFRCMEGVVGHLRQCNYHSVTLTDSSGLPGFYERFGFELSPDVARRWRPRSGEPGGQ